MMMPADPHRGYWSTVLFQNDFGRGGPRLGRAVYRGPWGLVGWWIEWGGKFSLQKIDGDVVL